MTETMTTTQAETAAQEQHSSLLTKAACGIRKGAADARKSAGNAFSAVGRLSAKAVYGTCYGISYGVTLTALGISMILPETMLRGFKEGAEAAEETIAHRQSESSSEAAGQPA